MTARRQKLHHIHAAAQASRLEFEALDRMTWRAEGRAPLALKAEVAYRAAVCWNVLEGIPTAALMDGVLLEIFEALDAGDLERARRAAGRLDAAADLTDDGMPHACEACRRAGT